MTLLIQISPFWYVIAPLAILTAMGLLYLPVHKAAGLGLLTRPALIKLQLAHLCSGLYLFAVLLTMIFERAVALPLAALVLAGSMTLLLRSARPGVNPGLLGFQWPFPKDGMDQIDREQMLEIGRVPWRWRLGYLAPAAPLVAVVLLAAASDRQRWWIWAVVGLAMTAPLLLVVYKRAWTRTTLLILAAMILMIRTLTLVSQLPAGTWITHWNAAPCSSAVTPSNDGTGWCLHESSSSIYQFDLRLGRVLDKLYVPAARSVFAAGSRSIWIEEYPNVGMSGASIQLHHFDHSGSTIRSFFDPQGGVLAGDDSFWLVDGQERLSAFSSISPEGDERVSLPDTLSSGALAVIAADDQSVWIGQTSGASQYDLESGQWFAYDQGTGLRGSVTDVAHSPLGSYWLLQTRQQDASPIWWVSLVGEDGAWTHFDLGALTGIGPPIRNQDSIAVDGLGRLWFIGHSSLVGEIYLGLLGPDGSLIHLAPIGSLLSRNSLRLTPRFIHKFGVVEDGAGGIYLYSGSVQPLRHWIP
jgi:hypothetical protein